MRMSVQRASLGVAAACLALATPVARAAEFAAPVAWKVVPAGVRGSEVLALGVAGSGERLALGDLHGVVEGRIDERFSRGLRRGPVRDLAYLGNAADAMLIAATEGGFYRILADGRVESFAPAPGDAARNGYRVAAVDGAVALATGAGAFVSSDARAWRRLAPGLPTGATTLVALRETTSAVECWTVVGGELWRTRLRRVEGSLVGESPRRERLPRALARGGPVDVVFDIPGFEVVVVHPTELAARRVGDAGWEVLRPNLPPGARGLRLSAGLGRLWLATDRGLLAATDLAGPWRRAASPAGGSPVRALARDATHVYAATADGLLLGSLASEAVASAAGIPRAILLEEPPIERVHRAALAHLALGPERIGRMSRDVRRRGWLPIASVRFARDLDRSVSRDSDEAFLSGDVRHLNDSDRDRSEDLALSLTFSWDFGDLAYHPEEIDISREAREVIELRDDILDEITQLYFDRRRALAQLTALGDSAGAEVESLRLRVAELTAGIDAWTGGWFGSRAWSPVP